MASKFICTDIWEQITAEVKRSSNNSHVAVAFFGNNASKMLPLKRGSTLVINMGLQSVKSGETNPTEVIKLLKKGVGVFSVDNLHAKTFVAGRVAIVGSSNASKRSKNWWIESAIRTTDKSIVASCKSFVERLADEKITYKYAKALEKIYNPPVSDVGCSRKKENSYPLLSPLWMLHIDHYSPDKEDKKATSTGMRAAIKLINSSRQYQIVAIKWDNDKFFRQVNIGDHVIQVMGKKNAKRCLYPTAKVLNVKKYMKKDGKHYAIIYLKCYKGLPNKTAQQVIKKIKVNKNTINQFTGAKLIKNSSTVRKYLSLWPKR